MKRESKLPLVVAFGLVAAFYVWTSLSDRLSWRWGREQTDYYNLLVDGFLQGKLSLGVEVPEELLRVKDPYDPDQRPAGVALHDVSLYRGKYYIYFGVVPAVLVLLPFRVVTGVDLPLGAAVLGFVLAGYAVQLGLLEAVRRRFFPRVGAVAGAAVGVVVGFASCTPVLLRRSSLYDVPISSGFFLAMAALACLYAALVRKGGRLWWVAASSLCWGLAVGCRPIYLLAPGCLVLACGFWLRAEREVWRDWRARGRLLGAAFGPLAAVGLLLAAYNYARFGAMGEFGVKYILSGVYEAKIEHFRLRYVAYNVFGYFFAPGEWVRYFPFRQDLAIPGPKPYQHMGMDVPFGLWVHLPFLWLAGGMVLVWRLGAGGEARGAWRVFLGGMSWAVASVLGFLLMFYAAMVRYTGDFAPGLAVLSAIAGFALLSWARARGTGMGRAVSWLVGALGGITVGVTFVFSAAVYDRLRQYNPRTFAALARIANQPVHAIEGLRGERSGLLALRMVLPEGKAGAVEELVATGQAAKDRVLVAYGESGRVRFGFEHAGAPVVWSEWKEIGRGEEQQLRVALGTLFPAESHPMWAGWPEEEQRALLRRVRIEVNGKVALERYQRFHDATPATVRVGGVGSGAEFSGRMVAVEREGVEGARADAARIAKAAVAERGVRANADGTLRLRVRFGELPVGAMRPVVVSGETGRGDILMVEALAAGQVRFVLDHWGRRPYLGPVVKVAPGREYRLEVTHPFYAPDGARRWKAGDGKMIIVLDGVRVWEFEPLMYPVEPEDIFVGFNPIGGSATGGGRWDGVVVER